MGMLAGAGLAIANARADLDRDRTAGVGSVAVALGERGSWLANAGTLAVALGLAVGWLAVTGQGSGPIWAIIAIGVALLAGGLGLGRSSSAARRERGWQAQAVGVAILAIGWIGAVALAD
jgi:4-hydroxybenzoate polyprenyltransferase